MSKLPAREQAQVNIRMPDDLRDRIKRSAEDSGRSMNGEIVHTLAEAYPNPVTISREETYVYLREWLRDLPAHDQQVIVDHLRRFAEDGFAGE